MTSDEQSDGAIGSFGPHFSFEQVSFPAPMDFYQVILDLDHSLIELTVELSVIQFEAFLDVFEAVLRVFLHISFGKHVAHHVLVEAVERLQRKV